MKTLEGKLTAKNMKIAIVVARFNEFITSKLLSGCVDCLIRHEAADEDLTVAWVPGAFEIPMATFSGVIGSSLTRTPEAL